jgi:serine O-acetyltransferase
MINIIKFLRFCSSQNILFLFRKSNQKSIIIKDIRRWQKVLSWPRQDDTPAQILAALFQSIPEFRNLFYFRLRRDPIRNHIIYLLVCKFLYPPKYDLVIGAKEDIGPGLFIQHGRSSGISVHRMGANCWINQHVSIGHEGRNERGPIIGDNVRITSGAKIYGAITIGDNVTIGANSVVVKDVPSNCTIVGVPGRIVKRDGKRVNVPL